MPANEKGRISAALSPINPSGSGTPRLVPGIHREGPGIALLADRAARDGGVGPRLGQRKPDVDAAVGAESGEIDVRGFVRRAVRRHAIERRDAARTRTDRSTSHGIVVERREGGDRIVSSTVERLVLVQAADRALHGPDLATGVNSERV